MGRDEAGLVVARAQEQAAAVRRCFAGRPDFLWQWNLDARALLMQLDFSVDAVLGVTRLYLRSFLEGELAALTQDIHD